MLGRGYQKYVLDDDGQIEIRLGYIKDQQFKENLNSFLEYKRLLNFIRLDENAKDTHYQVRYWDKYDTIEKNDEWYHKNILYTAVNTDYLFRINVYKKKTAKKIKNKPVTFTRIIHRESIEYTFGSVTVKYEISNVENIDFDGKNVNTYEFKIKLKSQYIDNEETEEGLSKSIEVVLKIARDTVLLYKNVEIYNLNKSIYESLNLVGNIQPSFFPKKRPLTYDDFPKGLIDGDYEYYASETPKGLRKIINFDKTGMWAWYPPHEYSLLARMPELQSFSDYIFEAIEVTPENRIKDSKYGYKNKGHHKKSVFYIVDCLSHPYYKTKIQEYGYKQRLKLAREFKDTFDITDVYLDVVSYHKIDRNNFFIICSDLLDFLNVEAPYVHDGLTFTPDTKYNPNRGIFISRKESKLKDYPDICRWYPKNTIDAHVRIDEDGNFRLWASGYVLFPGNLNPEDPVLKDKNDRYIGKEEIIEFEYDKSLELSEFLPLKGIKVRNKYQPNTISQIEDIWKLMKDPITENVLSGISNFSLMSHYHERIINLLGGLPLKMAIYEDNLSVESIFVDTFDSTTDVYEIAIKKLIPGGTITFLTFDRDAIKELERPNLGGYSQSKFIGPGFTLELDGDIVILRNEEGEEITYKCLDFDLLSELGTIEKYRADTEIDSIQPPLLNNREYLLSRIHSYGEITLSLDKHMSSNIAKPFCGRESYISTHTEFGSYLTMIPSKSKNQIQRIYNNWDPSSNEDPTKSYVRIGSIPDGSCFFHSVLQAIYPEYNNMTRKEKIDLVIHLRYDLSTFIQEEIEFEDSDIDLSRWALYGNGQLALQHLFQIKNYQRACYYRYLLKDEPYKQKYKDPRDPIFLEGDTDKSNIDYEKEDKSELGLVLRIANSQVYTGEVESDFLSDALDIDFLIFELRETGLPPVRTTRRSGSNRKCVMIGYTGDHYETIGKLEKDKSGEPYIKFLWDSDSLPVGAFNKEALRGEETFDDTLSNFLEKGNEVINDLFENLPENEDDRLVVFRYFRYKDAMSPSFDYLLTYLFRNYKKLKNMKAKGPAKISQEEWPDEKDEDEDEPFETCMLDQIQFLKTIDPQSKILKEIEKNKKSKQIKGTKSSKVLERINKSKIIKKKEEEKEEEEEYSSPPSSPKNKKTEKKRSPPKRKKK